MRNDRYLLLVIKIIPTLLRRLRNKYFSLAFNTINLRVGYGSIFKGSKSIDIGKNVLLGNCCWLETVNNGELIISDDVSFSHNVHIAAAVEVKIGKGCLIGSNVLITDHNHKHGYEYKDVIPKSRGLQVKGPSTIGENCWIADGVKILSGVSIGNNVVVAANSVVNRSFPDNVIIGGSPAIVISKNKSVSHER